VTEPTRRTTARVVPVSPDGAYLLLELDPVRPTRAEAAVRELGEEMRIVGWPDLPDVMSGAVAAVERLT
jgi:hypothetical protein